MATKKKPAAKAKAPAPKTKVTGKKGGAKPVARGKLDVIGIETICERISNCISLQVIADDAKVSKGSLITWLAAHPDQYARAREAQADRFAEEILAIADTPQVGEKVKINEDGEREVTQGDMIEHRRLRVDARKWLASKMAPKKYGDKLALGQADDLLPLVMVKDMTGRGSNAG